MPTAIAHLRGVRQRNTEVDRLVSRFREKNEIPAYQFTLVGLVITMLATLRGPGRGARRRQAVQGGTAYVIRICNSCILVMVMMPLTKSKQEPPARYSITLRHVRRSDKQSEREHTDLSITCTP